MTTLITKIISQRFLSITPEDLDTATPSDLLSIIMALDELLRSHTYMQDDTVADGQKLVDIMGQINALYQLTVDQTNNPESHPDSKAEKQTKITEILAHIKQIADFNSQK